LGISTRLFDEFKLWPSWNWLRGGGVEANVETVFKPL
jgi:hypothetical protein